MAAKTKTRTGKNGTEGSVKVQIPPIQITQMDVTLVGDTPLVINKFSEKAQQQIAEKQGEKKAPKKLPPRVPKEEYEAATYRMPDGTPAMRAVAFKHAAVAACRFVDGLPMTEARGAFQVMGDLVPIKGKPRMRTDTVRLESGTTTLRYRPEFLSWSVTVTIRFNAEVFSADQIIGLLNLAGFHGGVGENRPQKSGDNWGMFHVEQT